MDDFVPFETDPLLDGDFFSTPQVDPTAAASTSSYLVAWSAAQIPAQPHVFGEVLGPNGEPIRRSFTIQRTNRPESHPSAASSGDGFFVVWERLDLHAVRAIRASRFDASGTPLPPEQFLVATGGFLPAAAFDGTSYLVVWQRPKSAADSRRDLAATRVTQAGDVLDPAGIVIADGTPVDHAQSVACGEGVCLVAWHAGGEVRALRIAPDGTVLDPGGILLARNSKSVPTTSVAFDGAAFLVGWQTRSGDMRGAEVSPDGLVTEPEFVIAHESTPLENPVVASDGAGHRFALYDRFDPSAGYNIRRARARVLGAPRSITPAGKSCRRGRRSRGRGGAGRARAP
jgi:hypothetical protein